MYQAAIVRNVQGTEQAEKPRDFENLADALAYTEGTPVSKDGNRPWVCTKAPEGYLQFLLIGGCPQVSMKERLYRTARIREDLDMPSIGGMLPGQIVAVKYWQHAYEAKTGRWLPLYFISATSDSERHLHEGTFATVYSAALTDFCL